MTDEKAFDLLVDLVKDVKKDTGTIREKQDAMERRQNETDLQLQDHDNKIIDLEKNKVSVDEYKNEVMPLKRAENSRKGFKMWAVKVLTLAGLAGFGAWIGKTF